jgi:Rieske Fe-S protein
MADGENAISRRRFCTEACQAASGAALAALIPACGGGSSSPTSPSGSASQLQTVRGDFNGAGVRVAIGGSPLAEAGGAVLIESIAGVFLISRTGGSTFSAIDAVCTHQSCTITGQDGASYVCPCHGSRYSRSGQVVRGPAVASLRQYPTTFADGVVTIAL